MLQALAISLIVAGAIALARREWRRPPDPIQHFIEEQRDRMRVRMRDV